MDATLVDAIKTLGFPIVACCFLAYILWKMAHWAMRTGDRLTAKVESHMETVGLAVSKISPQLDRIEDKVDRGACRADEAGRKSVRHA